MAEMVSHLDRFPAGDYYSQMLLATLCAMVASFSGTKATPFEFAPWLKSPEDRAADRLAQQLQKRSHRRHLISKLPVLKRGKRSA